MVMQTRHLFKHLSEFYSESYLMNPQRSLVSQLKLCTVPPFAYIPVHNIFPKYITQLCSGTNFLVHIVAHLSLSQVGRTCSSASLRLFGYVKTAELIVQIK